MKTRKTSSRKELDKMLLEILKEQAQGDWLSEQYTEWFEETVKETRKCEAISSTFFILTIVLATVSIWLPFLLSWSWACIFLGTSEAFLSRIHRLEATRLSDLIDCRTWDSRIEKTLRSEIKLRRRK